MHALYFCCTGCVVPSTELLVIAFCCIHSCPFLSIRFFILSDVVMNHGEPWEPAKNATFLNTWDTRHEPQILSGAAVHAHVVYIF